MNKLNNLKRTIAVLVLVLVSTIINAQEAANDSVQFCKVALTNGNIVTGVLLSEDSTSITVDNSSLGSLKVLKSNVESVTVVEVGGDYSFTMRSGKVYRGVVVKQDAHNITILMGSSKMGLMTASITDFNPGATVQPISTQKRVDHGSRYLFAPSAIPLKKGDGYYHNAMILVNGWHYGITDNWSVGGGMIFPIGVYGQFKYGKQVADKVHVAGGGMFVTTFFDIGLGVACGFGSVTYGDRNSNATFSLGYGAAGGNGDWEATSRPIINVSAMARLSDNVSLITENYLFPQKDYRYMGNGEFITTRSYYAQLSAGFRLGGGRHSFDIAAMSIGDITDGQLYAAPFLGYCYRFSDK